MTNIPHLAQGFINGFTNLSFKKPVTVEQIVAAVKRHYPVKGDEDWLVKMATDTVKKKYQKVMI